MRKIKRIIRRQGHRHTDLKGPETRNFIKFWQNLYKNTQPPDLPKDTPRTSLSNDQILQIIKRMPDKKAPGPDGVTAELLKKGGTAALEMTT